MWIYEKRLEYPVNITRPDLRMAKLLMAQYLRKNRTSHKGSAHRVD